VFSVYSAIYKASMPISSNGVLCGALGGDFLYVGAGDGKIKKINLANGGWTLTHEALLDSKVMSINLSPDHRELIVGTIAGKIYRVLTNDFSFLLHSDAHSSAVNDVCFGKDSNNFVSIDESGSLKVWDLSEYKTVASMHVPKVQGGVCCTVAKDDGTVITGWRDGYVRCFDITRKS